MTIIPGVWIIFIIPPAVLSASVAYAGPDGRHRAFIESLPRSSVRRSTRAFAHGWISSGFRSAAMLARYFGDILFQTPDRSGLPSAVRGAGAARFALPLGKRGVPAFG